MNGYPAGAAPDFHRQAQHFLSVGDYAQSLKLAEARLRAVPEDVPAALIRCRSWLGLGNLDEAAAAFAAVESLNGKIGQVLKLLGDAFRRQGDHGRAAKCYQRSLALLSDVEELREARGSLGEIMEEEDGGPVGGPAAGGEGFQTLTMAELHIRQGHYEEAREILTAVLLREPERREARRRLSEVLELINEKNRDLPIDKKTTVVHELSRWLVKLGGKGQ